MQSAIYDFSKLTGAIDAALHRAMAPWLAVLLEFVIIGLVFLIFYAILGLYLVYAERKVCAIMQNRVGPNRVGKWGLMQTIADLIKLLMKELIWKEARIVASRVTHGEFNETISALKNGLLKPDVLISDILTPDKAQHAFEILESEPDKHLKILLKMSV